MKFFKWLFRKRVKVTIDPSNCKHPKWSPESKDNGWRETCTTCGTQAYGSCQ